MMDHKGTKGGLWNKAKIRSLLETSDKAVCRAMEVLYDRQTQDEQQASDTRHSNRMGFRAGGHAISGSYFGRWVKSGRKLTGHHLEKAREIALHYTQQLADVANAKASAAQPVMQPDTVSNWERQPGDESESVEREMHRIEAEGDRAQTEHDEYMKRAAKNIAEGRCGDGCCGPEELFVPNQPIPGTYA